MTARSMALGLLLAAAALCLPAGGVLAQDAGPGRVFLRGNQVGANVLIPINQSQVIEVTREITQVSVGNPEIADVAVLGPRTVYVFARQFGTTTMTLTGEDGEVISVVQIEVAQDVGVLKRKLHSLLPGERIAVHAVGEGIVLTGNVGSGAAANAATKIAEKYAPGQVLNMMKVAGSQQVMLAVHFVEMQRQVAKEIGVDITALAGNGTVAGLFGIGSGFADAFASVGINVTSGNANINALLDLLEQKGVVRTLAEPNLVALSGDTANFLAGGEFPVPVAQSEGSATGGAASSAITVEFKPFGVGLAFTPTVLDGNEINLELKMEVSELDPTGSVTIQGLTVSGLSVRRASTTVELRSGESFAIAGLLSENFRDNAEQLPGIGDIPILGMLVRSAQYKMGQTELVMIVTPYLVRPTTMANLAVPGFVPPSEDRLFLFGDVESNGVMDPALNPNAGLVGPAGYAVQ